MHTRHLPALLILCCVFTAYVCAKEVKSQNLPWEPLTNSDILRMVRAKVSAAEIVARIKKSRCHFDTNPTVLDELRYKRVPEAVLVAMYKAPFGTPVPSGGAPTAEVARKEILQTRSSSSPITPKEVKNKSITSPTGPTPTASINSLPVTGNLAKEKYSPFGGMRAQQTAQAVFDALRATQAFQGAPYLPYRVEVIERSDAQAETYPDGHVQVTSRLAELMEDVKGLSAAVEGHEIAHAMYQHGYNSAKRKAALEQQIAYWQTRVALGDPNANAALLAIAARKLINNKLDRNDENDADKLGLRMMVEAGYHPAFAIMLFRILKGELGEHRKIGALFSDHPRFITREERIWDQYPELLALFRSHWPDAGSSPGGSPPILATVTKVSSKEDKTNKIVSLQIIYTIHNAKGRDLAAEFRFFLKGVPVRSTDPAIQDKDGLLVAVRHFKPTSDEESSQLETTVPTSAVGVNERNLKANACLFTNMEVLSCSKEFEVSFPKN